MFGNDFLVSTSRYIANAVIFDGTNDYLDNNLAFAADSKFISLSMWIKPVAASKGKIIFNSTNNRCYAACRSTTGVFQCEAKTTGGATTLRAYGSTELTNNQWHHILFSVDLANSSNRYLYIDDSADTPDWDVYLNNNIDWTDTENAIGANVTGTSKIDASIADLWVDNTAFLTDSLANRRKFINANGKPEFLGDNGELPTGTSPRIFLSGATASWHTNKGLGGGFTENGALTTASTSPSD